MERELRDEIALEAMKYWLRCLPLVSEDHDEIALRITQKSYALADMMIEAKKRLQNHS